MDVDVQGIIDRFPRPLDDWERKRLELLAQDSLDLIRVEFAKRGRDFDAEAASESWLAIVAARVVREMVSASILVGTNVGVRSASSQTGDESDSITYATVNAASWGGVTFPDWALAELGLRRVVPRGRFGSPIPWPERRQGGGYLWR